MEFEQPLFLLRYLGPFEDDLTDRKDNHLPVSSQSKYGIHLSPQPPSHNIAPAKTATITVPKKPNPALLTCGVTTPAAAPALSLVAALPVPLALPSVSLAVELAPPVGVPVAVAEFVPLQKMI